MSEDQTPDSGLPQVDVSTNVANIVQVATDAAPVESSITTTGDGNAVTVVATVQPAVVSEASLAQTTEQPQEPQEEEIQSVPVPIPELTDAANVQQDYEVHKKGSNAINGELKAGVVTIAMPTARAETITTNLDHPSANVKDDKGQVWAATISEGNLIRPFRDLLDETVAREGSEFRQGLDTGNGRLSYYSPKFSDKEGQKLTGENAVLRMRSLMGMGGLVSIPLYHSGFHLTIKTPRDADCLALKEQNENARIRVGRMTFGLAFSNTSGYLAENIINLIRDHIYSSTLNVPDEEIMSRISVLDLPILVWGLACAQWPSGFQYARSNIFGKTEIDQNIITGLIDVAKLLWVDNSAFTDKQKAQMSIRQQRQVTKDVQDLYKSQFTFSAGRAINLKDDVIVMNLQVPSVTDYINSSHRWIDSLIQSIDIGFTGDRTDFEGRNRAIMNHANLSRMRQYGHWIRSITMEGVEYSEKEEIEHLLDVLSENEELRDTYFAAIEKFINDSTVAVIAIPETSGKETNLPRFPHLIPIDAIVTFFTLLVHRLNRATMQTA